MKNKLDVIDELLNDEAKLEKYINDVENLNIVPPNKLEQNIKNKLGLENSNKQNKTKVYRYSFKDILKIVACTVFAIIMWQFVFAKPIAYATENDIKVKRNEIYDKIDETMEGIKDFFMQPILLKGDKKI